MSMDAFVHQLPDLDPTETAEWLDSLDSVVGTYGPVRARFLLAKLLERAGQLGVGSPASVSTPYVNTIPPESQAWFPGDEYLERRIRAYIRWNAAVMVVKANHASEGIGGHLSTYSSSAALYEVGFNWFFRGADDGTAGDHVFFQGHASPGIYARAFLEGRLSEHDLDRFRREVDGGLSSYPHPHLMPDFWEFSTVSMGLGAITSIYQARFDRYLANRHIEDTSGSRTWCFLGDGEVDEVETLGALTLPVREGLDNLTWVVNCNLQRLDGPVRGNGKIMQELESVFRGAGWNVIKVVWGSKWDELLESDVKVRNPFKDLRVRKAVYHAIKVIWGSDWDELLAKDVDGVLLDKMNATVDGEFQRMAVESGAYIREHFFGPDPRLRAMGSSGRRQRSRNSREALAEPRNSPSNGPSASSPSNTAAPASPPSVSSGEPGRPVRMSAAVTSTRWVLRAAAMSAPRAERAPPLKSSAGTDSSRRSAAWITPALDFSR